MDLSHGSGVSGPLGTSGKEFQANCGNRSLIAVDRRAELGIMKRQNQKKQNLIKSNLTVNTVMLKMLKVDGEGTYQCTETGLIFEVNRKVDIKYCVLSWSKYSDLIVKPWAVGGPLFDVKCDPLCLTSIQFPHSLCLGHRDANMTFKVFHVKSTGASLEYTVDHSATHVKWRVSSLSPVGPVVQSEETVFHHGAVILYKAIDHNPSLSFRVYVATNNESFIKDISKSVKHSSKKFMKIDKPPVCQKLLQNGKKYRLISEPEAEITPEEIEFVDGSLLKLKSYIEVYLEQPVEFKLLLVEMDSEEIVWKAKLRECDWVQHHQNQNISKSSTSGNRRRKMSSSLPDEMVYDKRMKQIDSSDGVKTKTLTDTQLFNLAEKLGKEWLKIAIANLKLNISEIDAIREKEDNVTISKFKMLKKWQEKEQNNATAQNLCNCLKNVDSVEVQDVLRDPVLGVKLSEGKAGATNPGVFTDSEAPPHPITLLPPGMTPGMSVLPPVHGKVLRNVTKKGTVLFPPGFPVQLWRQASAQMTRGHANSLHVAHPKFLPPGCGPPTRALGWLLTAKRAHAERSGGDAEPSRQLDADRCTRQLLDDTWSLARGTGALSD
ncbi:hypothetical protein M91_10084 [Bos mutus]|uniref:Caspase recruitment domain-containing protein 8 n=1 Tax=Bos mutus TaxID=72004 RepID=L8I1Q9_9CETA|nr:hypothetical protein M91_10084 [Bos mutus]